MKELKFRTWNKKNKKMGFISILGLGNLVSLVGSEIDFFLADEIMEYTGLKDAKGKEIYAGDIVLFDEPMPIEMKNGCWVAKRKYKQELLLLTVNDNCKILGNIYENPEILEDK